MAARQPARHAADGRLEQGVSDAGVLLDAWSASVESTEGRAMVGLPKRFSNKRPALKSLISRVLKGSERRGPRNRTPKRHDSRGAVAKNPAKSQTRLTTEQRVNLLADYEAGIPVRAIAAKYGVHRGTIPKFVLGSGGTLRTPGLDEAGRVRATALYADGLTLKEVAEKLGVDDKTVRNAVVQEGGRLRPRGRRPAHANTK